MRNGRQVFIITLGVIAVAVLIGVFANWAGDASSRDSRNEHLESPDDIVRRPYPDDGVICYVYDSTKDTGSGISCVVVGR